MTMVKAVAKSSFYHGRTQYEVGHPIEISKGEASDLEKDGLIERVEEETEIKMESAPKNKMADATVNKASKKAD